MDVDEEMIVMGKTVNNETTTTTDYVNHHHHDRSSSNKRRKRQQQPTAPAAASSSVCGFDGSSSTVPTTATTTRRRKQPQTTTDYYDEIMNGNFFLTTYDNNNNNSNPSYHLIGDWLTVNNNDNENTTTDNIETYTDGMDYVDSHDLLFEKDQEDYSNATTTTTIKSLTQQLTYMKRLLWPAAEECAEALNHFYDDDDNSHNHNHNSHTTPTTANKEFVQARSMANPMEMLGVEKQQRKRNHHHYNHHHHRGRSWFLNRSAIKLANIDQCLDLLSKSTMTTITTTTMTKKKNFPSRDNNNTSSSSSPSSSSSSVNTLVFVDLCGAPGGFSEYVIRRFHSLSSSSSSSSCFGSVRQQQQQQPYHHHDHHYSPGVICRGYGMSLHGTNEHGKGLKWKLHNVLRQYCSNDNDENDEYEYDDYNEYDDNYDDYGNNDSYNDDEMYDNNQNEGRRTVSSISYHIVDGDDGTGDIYNWDNVVHLRDHIQMDLQTTSRKLFGHNGNDDNDDDDSNDNFDHDEQQSQQFSGVNLVLADGGMDQQRDHECQEEVCQKLVLCEMAAALELLAPHGHFVIKMFGFQTPTVRHAMTSLSERFDDHWSFLKPVSSRPASSERYVVFRNYKGRRDDWRGGQDWINSILMGTALRYNRVLVGPSAFQSPASHLTFQQELDQFDKSMLTLNLRACNAILTNLRRKKASLEQQHHQHQQHVAEWNDLDGDDWERPTVPNAMYRQFFRLDSILRTST